MVTVWDKLYSFVPFAKLRSTALNLALKGAYRPADPRAREEERRQVELG